VLDVRIALAPRLHAGLGDRILLKLDGAEFARLESAQAFSLPGVPFGTHTLQAEVIDAQGRKLIASTPVTFDFNHILVLKRREP
jgi:hypothetical protein